MRRPQITRVALVLTAWLAAVCFSAARERFGVLGDAPVVLVACGSQGVRSINNAADLIVSRAGASTAAELALLDKPAAGETIAEEIMTLVFGPPKAGVPGEAETP